MADQTGATTLGDPFIAEDPSIHPIFQPITEHPTDCDNSGTVPLQVPGFGLPLGYPWKNGRLQSDEYFHGGANDFSAQRMTIREVAMLGFMDALTDKPDWHRKVFDEEIVEKWRAEATSAPKSLISSKAFDWCVTELRDRAAAFERDGLIRTLEGGARVIKSDTVINQTLRSELLRAVQPLFDVSESQKDWHPNSNQQVLNLVHPSLYPLVYGRSRILETGQVDLLKCMQSVGRGKVPEADQASPQPENRGGWRHHVATVKYWSNRFQWLPAEVKFVGESGTKVKLASYINNLRPQPNKILYEVVEKFISAAIPAWNEVLASKYKSRLDVRIRAYGAEIEPPELPEWAHEWNYEDEGCAENQVVLEKMREYIRLPDRPDYAPAEGEEEEELPENIFTALPSEWEPERDSAHGEWSVYDVVQWKYLRMRNVSIPEPGVKYSYEQWVKGDSKAAYGRAPRYGSRSFARDSYTVKLEEQFRKKGLQVIVKLSSIELTPDNPKYEGGSWHLEGMLNEHIVGTAIYYYDVENCTPSRLRFRQESDVDEMSLSYEQDDHDPLSKIFGTESMRDEPAVQEIGSVDTRDGRLLVFPNTLQHKVESFELLDATKPGHRRFLVLWLVDPHYRITSTANVAPQQEDWWTSYIRADEWERELPQEVKDEIVEYAKEGMMTLEEAKELRLELMQERTSFVDTVESRFETYNLCEH